MLNLIYELLLKHFSLMFQNPCYCKLENPNPEYYLNQLQ